MIYLISDFLLIFVESDNVTFLKQLIGKWMEDKRLYRYDLSGRGTNIINKMMNNLRNILLIRKLLKNTNYKIIFFEWGSTLLSRATKFITFKKPVVVRIHRYEIFNKTLNRVNFDKVNRIILVSHYMKEKLLEQFPNLENKIVIIPNSVKLDKFYTKPNKQRTFRICTLSYLEERKRIDLVIDAMKHLKNSNIKLHIGGVGKFENQLRTRIKEAKLTDRVFLEGRIKNLRDWYFDKDLIINSSNSEGFPVSVLEAMACSVIPLIRGWGGAKDLFPEEFVLPYNELNFPKALAEKMNEFYQLTPEIFKLKRESIRDFVSKHYSFKTQIQNFENLFNSLK